MNPRSVESIMIMKDNQGRLEEAEESEMVDVEEGLLVFSKIKQDMFHVSVADEGSCIFQEDGEDYIDVFVSSDEDGEETDSEEH